MQINTDGRGFQGLTALLGFVGLNVVYLVCCLPIVTIGAATSALFEVMIRYADHESGRPVKDFFPAFRQNFRHATLASLILLVPAVMLVFSAVFWILQPTIPATIAAGIAAVGALYLFTAFLHAMALVAQYRNTLRQTLKNALLLVVAEPLRTLGIVLIPATLLSLTVIFPAFGVILVTIGFSFGAYLSAFLFRGIFARRSE